MARVSTNSTATPSNAKDLKTSSRRAEHGPPLTRVSGNVETSKANLQHVGDKYQWDQSANGGHERAQTNHGCPDKSSSQGDQGVEVDTGSMNESQKLSTLGCSSSGTGSERDSDDTVVGRVDDKNRKERSDENRPGESKESGTFVRFSRRDRLDQFFIGPRKRVGDTLCDKDHDPRDTRNDSGTIGRIVRLHETRYKRRRDTEDGYAGDDEDGVDESPRKSLVLRARVRRRRFHFDQRVPGSRSRTVTSISSIPMSAESVEGLSKPKSTGGQGHDEGLQSIKKGSDMA
ncbi:hypothetical protein BGX31_001481, partial [Mortierella sp. GBA43]